MVRHVFIVSRAHPWLYSHLLERFSDDPNVLVVLDRRLAERRRGQSTCLHPERRKGDRRRTVRPEDDLHTRSHYIVEI